MARWAVAGFLAARRVDEVQFVAIQFDGDAGVVDVARLAVLNGEGLITLRQRDADEAFPCVADHEALPYAWVLHRQGNARA